MVEGLGGAQEGAQGGEGVCEARVPGRAAMGKVGGADAQEGRQGA